MTRVLVPVAVLEGETVSSGLVNLLGTVDVTVLGYHVLPEQTPPDQARRQYEDRATDALADLCEELRAAGGDADHRLVFTRDRDQTVDRVADEVGAAALAVSGVTGDADRLLVSLSGDVATDRILAFVEELVGDRDIGVTLFLAGEEDTEAERLDTAAQRLRDGGFDLRAVSASGDPFEALVDEVPGHDAVVMGEQAPSFRSLVFGEKSHRVASASVGPVLVVRSAGADESDRSGESDDE
jgi:nucleotide-binding universal stress UspA family protein